MPERIISQRSGSILHLIAGTGWLWGALMIAPALISWHYHESHAHFFSIFSLSFIIVFWPIWRVTKPYLTKLKPLENCYCILLTWLLTTFVAAIPFWHFHVTPDFLTAWFESTSGLTTTGAEIIFYLDDLSHTIRFYHQYLQFIGGLGMVVLMLSIFHMGPGSGMLLLKADAPGAGRDQRMTPKMQQTALWLCRIYLTLTILCTLGYWISGLSWFQAICLSFGTVSTGGFDIHDTSLMLSANPWTLTVCMIFMILGSLNFLWHFRSWKDRSLSGYHSHECRWYIKWIIGCTLLMILIGWQQQLHESPGLWLREALFSSISMITTTGFANHDFSKWPAFFTYLLTIFGLIGGCSGSTSGGIKIMRLQQLLLDAHQHLRKMTLPQVVQYSPNHHHTSGMTAQGFLVCYIATYIILIGVMLWHGNALHDAFYLISACISNVGFMSDGYSMIDPFEKGILMLTMIIGRVEIISFLVLCLPSSWQS
jgi:trk system potassium uptake protein